MPNPKRVTIQLNFGNSAGIFLNGSKNTINDNTNQKSIESILNNIQYKLNHVISPRVS